MSETAHIGIIGAGIVGLSSALWLQRAGFKVTLIDRDDPGLGASYGNAGLFADYARLPFANFGMMCKMPGMLIDSQSPLSLKGNYLPKLVPYGWRFLRACLPGNYRRGREALTELQRRAPEDDQILLRASGAEDLVRSAGCLGLFGTDAGFAKAKRGDLSERRDQGVAMELLDAAAVADLEPDLAGFHAGGVYYPQTRFTVSPVELSRRYADHFAANGGRFVRQQVRAVEPNGKGVRLQTTLEQLSFDHLVIAAGIASKGLCQQLGLSIPLVSERGYHLTLKANGKQLRRPVGWLDKAVYLTPMHDGIRVAGTAEFADADAPPDRLRTSAMLNHAERMLGTLPEVGASWVGSRPSTPDSLPVIGSVPNHPRVVLAFGHGHLGLTLGSVTGRLVAQQIQGQTPSVAMQAFAPTRFH